MRYTDQERALIERYLIARGWKRTPGPDDPAWADPRWWQPPFDANLVCTLSGAFGRQLAEDVQRLERERGIRPS